MNIVAEDGDLSSVFIFLWVVFVAGSFLLPIGGMVIGIWGWYKMRRVAEGYPDS